MGLWIRKLEWFGGIRIGGGDGHRVLEMAKRRSDLDQWDQHFLTKLRARPLIMGFLGFRCARRRVFIFEGIGAIVGQL